MRSLLAIAMGLYLVAVLYSCESITPKEPLDNELLDGPIEGLTQEQLRLFLEGDIAFGDAIFTPETGLGSVFVANSCGSCHPGDGKGHPFNTLTRFGKFNNGVFDHLIELGGPQLQNRAIPGFTPEQIPQEATGIADITAPAVTGLGFLEEITDQMILDMSDPFDLNGDGISGVPNYIVPPDFFEPKASNIEFNGMYIGRFGKKALTLNLLHQTVGAYKQDMGITSDFDLEEIFNPLAGNQSVDNVPDPEVPASTVRNVVFYLRTLKAPIQRDANNAIVLQGKIIFEDIGCGGCHIPTLNTGDSDLSVLSNKVIHPYTDLLLHDMGPQLDDGYTEGTALTSEWRTPPLWGLGLAADAQGGNVFLLHDGRAKSIEEAILFHGGESEPSKIKFVNLSEDDKSRLKTFLESL